MKEHTHRTRETRDACAAGDCDRITIVTIGGISQEWRGKIRKCSEVQVPGFKPVEWWEAVIYQPGADHQSFDDTGWPRVYRAVHAPGADFTRVLHATNVAVANVRGYFRHGDWIVQSVDACTCYAGSSGMQHEPGCGLIPIAHVPLELDEISTPQMAAAAILSRSAGL